MGDGSGAPDRQRISLRRLALASLRLGRMATFIVQCSRARVNSLAALAALEETGVVPGLHDGARPAQQVRQGRQRARRDHVGRERRDDLDPLRVDRRRSAAGPGGLAQERGLAPVALDQMDDGAPMTASTRPGRPAPLPRSARTVRPGRPEPPELAAVQDVPAPGIRQRAGADQVDFSLPASAAGRDRPAAAPVFHVKHQQLTCRRPAQRWPHVRPPAGRAGKQGQRSRGHAGNPGGRAQRGGLHAGQRLAQLASTGRAMRRNRDPPAASGPPRGGRRRYPRSAAPDSRDSAPRSRAARRRRRAVAPAPARPPPAGHVDPGQRQQLQAVRRTPSCLTSSPWRAASSGVEAQLAKAAPGRAQRGGLGRERAARPADAADADAARGQPQVGVVGAQR